MTKRMSFIFTLSFFLSWSAMPSTGQAETTKDDSSNELSTDLNWHSFVSQGFIKSSANNYLALSQEGSFDFTEVGLNVTKPISDKVDLGAQLFARKFGPVENFNVKFDWFYADYQASNWFKFKVGRIKIPYGLYNDLSDIDAARVPILLPQSVYPSQNRNYLLAQNGAQIYGFGDLGSLGSLDYHLYGGSINIDRPPITSASTIVTQIDVPHLFGGRLLWETPLDGLKTAFTLQKASLDVSINEVGVLIKAAVPVTQALASLEYTYHHLMLASEYGRQYVELQSASALLPHSYTISEQYYILANYQLGSSIAPGIYYSMLTPDITERGSHEKRQGDLALYVRYDFSSNWLLKLEGHLMSGTAGLDPNLNDNTPISSLNDNWQVLILKTTAYF